MNPAETAADTAHQDGTHEDGLVVLLVALSLTALIGIAGMATDIGIIEVRAREAQNASDAAALAAGYQIYAGSTETAATTVARQVVAADGFSSDKLTLSYLDADGNATSDPSTVSQVQASVGDNVAAVFTKVLRMVSSSVTRRATAHVMSASACALCLLGSSGTDLSIVGNATIDISMADGQGKAAGVTVDSNSSSAIAMTGAANLTAPTINVVGDISRGANTSVDGTVHTGASAAPDPFSAIPPPTVTTNYGNVTASGNQSIGPGIYGNITVSGNATLSLGAGTYVITGSLSVGGGGSLTGNGVTLYLACASYPTPCSSGGQAGGSISLGGNGTFSLAGPTSGNYQGLTVFADRNNTSSSSIAGNGSDSFTGSMYARSAAVTITGNGSAVPIDSLIVARQATLTGNGGINLTFNRSLNYQSVTGPPVLSQ